MKKIYALATGFLLLGHSVFAQSFSNSSNLIPGSYNSGGPTGVWDMDNDGLDDIVILDQSTHVYVAYQQPNGSFVIEDYGSVSSEAQWGMCVGDIDNDGHGDVMAGGSYDGVHILNIDGPGDYTLTDPQNVQIFMQACNFADIDNDGWLDGFACHDDGPSHRFRNDGAGSFTNGNSLFNYNVYPNSDMSGNYGSEWSDFDRDGDLDLMVAKCRQFVNDPYDPRRTNLLFVNDGNNNYVDEAHERGLVNLEQSWTSNFADMDNDGDFDCFITTHSGTLEIYENDGLGYFTDVTAGSGLEIGGFFLQGKLADFDNDGFVDIIYAGGNAGFFHNNGDMTFTSMANMFPANDTMHGFAIGDLDNDGWVDVYANYGNSYVTPDNGNDDRLFLNNGGSNHWVGFDLEGTISNMGAVGALVEIHGAWGIQIREVRAGESYGITNSSKLMFGIGTNTSIDYAVIHWPAGGMLVIEDPAIDTYHEFIEGDCTAPVAQIDAAGNTFICEGQSTDLEVTEASASYLWNTGASTQTITVTEPGNYSVYVYDPNTNCAAISNVISVEVQLVVEPTINVSGDLEFCEGSSVELVASEGESYLWSSGEETQAISVTEAGSYSVVVEGACGMAQSGTIDVTVLDAPNAPVAEDVVLSEAGFAEITATGADLRWYDSETADTPIGSGSPFTTPYLTSTTSFWVEDVTTYGGEEGQGGKLVNESAPYGQYHNSASYWNTFDAYEDIIINSVKVFAGNAGERTIVLVDANGTTLAEGTYDIPQGESYVTLNYFVPAGSDYGLRTTTSNPQLWRDRNTDESTPFEFPYDLGGLATITGTTVTGNDFDNYYYFFYDWTVQTPEWECASPREEVQVIIVGVEEIEGMSAITLFPNPASDVLTMSFHSTTGGTMQVNVIDQSGRRVQSTQLVSGTGTNRYELEVEGLAAGVYQLQVVKNGQQSSQRFVIK